MPSGPITASSRSRSKGALTPISIKDISRTTDFERGRAIKSIELAGAGGYWATFWIAVGSVADLLVLQ